MLGHPGMLHMRGPSCVDWSYHPEQAPLHPHHWNYPVMPEPLRYGHWQVADGLPRRTRPAAVYCQPSLKHANAYLEMTLTPEGLEPTLVEGAPDVAVELQALAAQDGADIINLKHIFHECVGAVNTVYINEIADLELLFDQLLEQRDETFRSLDNDGDGEITSEEMAAMRAMAHLVQRFKTTMRDFKGKVQKLRNYCLKNELALCTIQKKTKYEKEFVDLMLEQQFVIKTEMDRLEASVESMDIPLKHGGHFGAEDILARKFKGDIYEYSCQ